MLQLLNARYREFSQRPGITPNQSHALADAACVLGSQGVPASMVRNAIVELEAAFENPSLGQIIPRRPIFRDLSPNYRGADQASSDPRFISHKRGRNLLLHSNLH
jgi:hypothetical protein